MGYIHVYSDAPLRNPKIRRVDHCFFYRVPGCPGQWGQWGQCYFAAKRRKFLGFCFTVFQLLKLWGHRNWLSPPCCRSTSHADLRWGHDHIIY